MKVIRVRLGHDGFNGLIRKGRDRVCIPLPPSRYRGKPMYIHSQKADVCKQEESLHEKPDSLIWELPVSRGGTNVSFLGHSVYDILL